MHARYRASGRSVPWRGLIITGGCVAVVAAAGFVAEQVVDLPWIGFIDDAVAYEPFMPPAPPEAEWDPAVTVLAAPVIPAAGSAGPGMPEVLAPLAAAAALGDQVGVSVIDLATGMPAYESAAATPQTPASTLKILTTVAALTVLGPGHTFSTRVVGAVDGLSEGGMITLVGGGDPTLTVDDGSGGTMTDLADITATELTKAGVASVSLTFDDSLFSGPAADPDWSPGYVTSDIVSPVSALGVDIAENRPADPAADAASRFAGLLRERGIAVASPPVRAVAPADGTAVAAVSSPPLSTIVEGVLTRSDNDGAEILARHVAVGTGLPGTSAAASVAITQTLTTLGLDMTSSLVLDGSGLARGSVVPAAVIAAALATAADPAHPELRAILTGLPVAGFSGTLADRFDDPTGLAAGMVRAKTGTLTGVSGLAGIATAQNGHSYVFAVLADEVSDTAAARDGLDDVAAALAACGCR